MSDAPQPVCATSRQFAALPWRDGPHGRQVLLITTRGGRRWLVPKGKPMAGKTAAEAAAQEAWEEAGVTGVIAAEPLGAFEHRKGSLFARRRLQVDLYPLEVTAMDDDWPERRQRERRWVSPATALGMIGSAELRGLIAGFCGYQPPPGARLGALLRRVIHRGRAPRPRT